MKKFLKITGLLVLVFVAVVVITTYPKLELITGYSAKNMASAHYIDGRTIQNVQNTDNDFDLVRDAALTLNEEEKSASATIYSLKSRKAIYRDGLGVTLITDDFDVNQPYLRPKRNLTPKNLPFPYGNLEAADTVFDYIDYKKLESAIANAFDSNGIKEKRTRSVLVVHKDKIIGEKYIDGFDKNSKILGWSMTKSITATYFGILQQHGKMDITQAAPIASWKKDKRKAITINDLLHMNSGLEWEEDYTKICDVTKMLYLDKDMAKAQALKPLIGKPNETWYYSSGTTNLLSGILRKQFPSHQAYLDFWYESLIDKIGMHSMLVETDMAGNYVGSSYSWATTRDWSKFGLLYLHKGNWNGEQIFDEGWAKYVATPTNTSDGLYGGHFWLNAGGALPDVPKDLYYCGGFQGQRVFIIPSLDLVIVRMGTSPEGSFDFNGFLKEVIGSFKK